MIKEDIAKYKRKKSISKEEALKESYYSIWYFNENNLPIRTEQIGGIPSETYLIWQNNKLVEVFEFRLGYRFTKKVADPGLASEYHYSYDDKSRVIKMIRIDHPDYEYYSHGRHEIHVRYEYDDKGLFRKYQNLLGFGPEIEGEDIIYDREKEELLSKCTVSKSANISKYRKPKKSVPFKREFYIKNNDIKVPLCKSCKQIMSYIGFVDLKDKRIKRKSNLEIIPIYCCFDCLEGNTINLKLEKNFKNIKKDKINTFPEEELDIVRSNDPDEIKEALIKIGSLPDWIQNDEFPKCPECDNYMIFVCQINSNEDISNGNDVQMFGDTGILYVFTCCNSVSTIMQWY
jgi:hypothetical protein